MNDRQRRIADLLIEATNDDVLQWKFRYSGPYAGKGSYKAYVGAAELHNWEGGLSWTVKGSMAEDNGWVKLFRSRKLSNAIAEQHRRKITKRANEQYDAVMAELEEALKNLR